MSPLWTTQGREYRPTPADLTPGWTPTPAIERGIRENDPGITRVIGAIERPLLLASGEQISLVALVATGDPDGREHREWIPITARIMRDGEARIAREAAPKPAPVAPTAPAPAERENPDHVRAVAVRAAHAAALPGLKAELAEAELRVSRLTATPARNKWGRAEAARAEERIEHLRWLISRPQAWAEARARHLLDDGIDHGSSPWGKEQE